MSRYRLLPCFLVWIGCSDRPVPSGSLDQESEPRLAIRCHEGRMLAYITLTPDDGTEADGIPEGAIPVELDSIPTCEGDESLPLMP